MPSTPPPSESDPADRPDLSPSSFSARLRTAAPGDGDAIRRILNPAIEATTASFATALWSASDAIEWLTDRPAIHPVIVAEMDHAIGTPKIAGYAALSQFDSKPGYDQTAELSVYVDPAFQQRGLGRQLIAEVLKRGFAAGLHCVLSRVSHEAEASIALHEVMGFEKVGTLRGSGWKFGRRLDVVIFQMNHDTATESNDS